MKCNSCHKNKKEDEFSFRNINKKILKTTCKKCDQKYRKEYYLKHSSLAKIASAKTTVLIRERNRQFVWDHLKTSVCVDCGNNNPVVLEFDHKEGYTKLGDISQMVLSGYSLIKIKNEIDKCDVRCSNCHRIKTARFGKYYKNVVK